MLTTKIENNREEKKRIKKMDEEKLVEKIRKKAVQERTGEH